MKGESIMAGRKALLGICAQHQRLSFAVMRGESLEKTFWIDIPEDIVSGVDIKSRNLFGELIRDTLKQNRVKVKDVAYVLSGENTFIRNLNIPEMDDEQIKYNIPFEFRDYIRGELKEYAFDYAHIPNRDPRDAQEGTISIMAAATPKEHLEVIKEVTQVAGLRLVKAAPDLCAFEKLLYLLPDVEERQKERCFLDFGHGTVRLFIYKNGRYKLMHMVHTGMRKVIETVADVKNVDYQIARTYLTSNYEDVQNDPECQKVYRDISVEILKGLNFYEMSDMSARLDDVVLCGGGAMVEPLVEMLKQRIMKNVVTMNEFLPNWNRDGHLNITAPSIGIAL